MRLELNLFRDDSRDVGRIGTAARHFCRRALLDALACRVPSRRGGELEDGNVALDPTSGRYQAEAALSRSFEQRSACFIPSDGRPYDDR